MIDFANAKINLGLHITGKRSDGYHTLESLFLPISLCDIIEILQTDAPQDSLRVLGDIDTGCTEDNLVLRAVRSLRQCYHFPMVDIVLKKQIPSGAGMGGGSSDATTTLKMLRQLFGLDISNEELCDIALGLGADCPFFVHNQPQLVTGIGEIFSPAPELRLEGYYLLLVKPHIHSSTAEAFRGLRGIGGHQHSVSEILAQPIELWREMLFNDFEASLFPLYPELQTIKKNLYALGAIYASMTGSGAALYGFFERRLSAEELSVFGNAFIWQSAEPNVIRTL